MSEELPVATDDDDQDALAAEYVLGTLSDEERTHAEALLTLDPAFETAVRHWERRLGELNVMVEAVEPPPEVWDRIKTQIGPVEPADQIALPARRRVFLPIAEEAAADTLPPAAGLETPPACRRCRSDVPPVLPPSCAGTGQDRARRRCHLPRAPCQTLAARDVSYGLRSLLCWQFMLRCGKSRPNLVPPQLRPGTAQPMLARSPAPARAQQDRLVAVLQPGPTAPAFLLTLDTQRRTLTVRKVSATAEAGKSYELWLISSRLGAPRSLGTCG